MPEPALTTETHDPYAALRVSNYRRFALGFVCSSAGLQMLGTAIGWEIYHRTHDALALGLIGVARALPVVALALPAGHLIDHYNRKHVLVITQAAMALVAAGLAVASFYAVPIVVLYALLVLAGCARCFNGPSRATLLPLIVEPGVFHNAVTWNSGVFQLSATLGPIIAGLLIDRHEAAWPVYAVTAALCAVFALTASTLESRPTPRTRTPFRWSSLFAGVDHLWREKTILSAITLDLFAVLLGGATALMPIFAKDILILDSIDEGTRLGLLRASPYIGAFVMALALAHRPPIRRSGPALLWSVALFGVAIIVFGVSKNFWLSLAVLFFAGAVDNISVVIRHVLVQVRTPDHLRGRVSSVNSVFIESSNELGAFESGLVAKLFTPVISVVSGGIGTLLVVLAVALCWPEIRRLGPLHEESTPKNGP